MQKHLLLYFFSNFIYGITYNMIPFTIPYLSQTLSCQKYLSNHNQQQLICSYNLLSQQQIIPASSFGIILFSIGIGNLIGSYLSRIIVKYLSMNFTLSLSYYCSFLFSGSIYFTKDLLLITVLTFFFSIFFAVTEVINVSILIQKQNQNQNQKNQEIAEQNKKKVQTTCICFSSGSIFCPLIFLIFKFQTLLVMSILYFLIAIRLMQIGIKQGNVLENPEKISKSYRKSFLPSQKQVHQIIQRSKSRKTSKIKNISSKTQIQLTKNQIPKHLLFCLYLYIIWFTGAYASFFGIWPSFISDMKWGNKKQGQFSIMLGFSMFLIGKFYLRYFPMQAFKAITYSCYLILIGITLGILILLRDSNQNYYGIHYMLYVFPLIFGTGLSNIYPMVFAFPLQSGFQINVRVVSNFVIVGSISYAILTELVTFCMYKGSLYFELGFIIFFVLMIIITINLYQDWSKNYFENQINIIDSIQNKLLKNENPHQQINNKAIIQEQKLDKKHNQQQIPQKNNQYRNYYFFTQNN